MNAKNNENKTYLTVALENKNFQIAKILSDSIIKIEERDLNFAFEVIN